MVFGARRRRSNCIPGTYRKACPSTECKGTFLQLAATREFFQPHTLAASVALALVLVSRFSDKTQ